MQALPRLSIMTVLRVLLAAAPAADRAETWALFDAAGACVRKGRDRSGCVAAGGPARDRARRVPGRASPIDRVAADAGVACRGCRADSRSKTSWPDRSPLIMSPSRRRLPMAASASRSRRSRSLAAIVERWRECRAHRGRARPRGACGRLEMVRAGFERPRDSCGGRMAAHSRSTHRAGTACCRPSWSWRSPRPVAATRRPCACASMRRSTNRRSRAGSAKRASNLSAARLGSGSRRVRRRLPVPSISCLARTARPSRRRATTLRRVLAPALVIAGLRWGCMSSQARWNGPR